MKKRKHFAFNIWFSNMKLLSLAVGILLVVLILSYTKENQRKEEEELSQMQKNITINITNSIQFLETISLQISNNPYVVEMIEDVDEDEDKNYFEDNQVIRMEVYTFLWSYILERDKVTRICIFNDKSDYLVTGQSFEEGETQKPDRNNYVKTLYEKFRKTDRHTIFQVKENGQEGALCISRKINKNGKMLGCVEVELSLKETAALIQQLCGANQNVEVRLWQKMTPDSDLYITENFPQEEKNDHMTKRYFYSEGEVPEYGIIIHLVKSKDAMRRETGKILFFGVAIYGILLIILGVLQKKVTTELARPLIELSKKVTEKNQDVTQEVNLEKIQVEDELGVLKQAFDDMLLSIQKATNREIAAKTSAVEAKLFALQAQMNPHFIHNTLFIVQAYAREENFKMVDEICEELSDMIRYSANWQQNVTLGEELRHVDCYMKLVKCRYEDGVRYFVKCDSVSEAIRMPQFILQPIVENSLEHGLKKREFPWIIEIKCYTENNCWMIEIWDNGIGITPDKKSEILLFLENIKMGNQDILEQGLKIGGLSLKNVIARLYLKYGENMYFDITEKREGTSVILGGSMDD